MFQSIMGRFAGKKGGLGRARSRADRVHPTFIPLPPTKRPSGSETRDQPVSGESSGGLGTISRFETLANNAMSI